MNKRAETDRKTDYFPSSLTLRGGGGARGEVQDKVSVGEAGGANNRESSNTLRRRSNPTSIHYKTISEMKHILRVQKRWGYAGQCGGEERDTHYLLKMKG